jgi:hypothetical protein
VPILFILPVAVRHGAISSSVVFVILRQILNGRGLNLSGDRLAVPMPITAVVKTTDCDGIGKMTSSCFITASDGMCLLISYRL